MNRPTGLATLPVLPATGEILPNGATVVLSRFAKNDLTMVVIWASRGPDDYMTWAARADAPRATFWGHYYGADVAASRRDYATR